MFAVKCCEVLASRITRSNQNNPPSTSYANSLHVALATYLQAVYPTLLTKCPAPFWTIIKPPFPPLAPPPAPQFATSRPGLLSERLRPTMRSTTPPAQARLSLRQLSRPRVAPAPRARLPSRPSSQASSCQLPRPSRPFSRPFSPLHLCPFPTPPSTPRPLCSPPPHPYQAF